MNTCLFSHSETIKINLKQFKLLGVESEWVFFTCHEHYPTDASDNQMKNTHCQSHEERLVSAPGYSLNYVHCCSLSSESLFPRYRENIRNTIPTPVSFTGWVTMQETPKLLKSHWCEPKDHQPQEMLQQNNIKKAPLSYSATLAVSIPVVKYSCILLWLFPPFSTFFQSKM